MFLFKVMCSGRVHPGFILEAFRSGAYGVLIAGCHHGDCHYLWGNCKAERRILMLRRFLKQLGLEPERLRWEWVSASEGDRFATIIKDLTKEFKKLGPSPLRAGSETGV